MPARYNDRMIDIDVLPVPDWGLRCEACGAVLAGASEHRCPRCDRPYSIRDLVARQRPIPDIGLVCPNCGYALTGLTVQRCPECGLSFSVRELIDIHYDVVPTSIVQLGDPDDHHHRQRDPTYDGSERPLPDFGLVCADCDAPLTGVEADACPECGRPFDLDALVSRGDWVDVSPYVPPGLAVLAKCMLYAEWVPYVVDNDALQRLYGGPLSVVVPKLRVPREFFFDALAVFAKASVPQPSVGKGEWVCPACDEDVPAGFEVCWNCGTAHPAITDTRPESST